MASRKITVALGLLSVACKSENAVEAAPESRNMCTGQPGKPDHEAKLVIAPTQCTECGEVTDRSALVKGIKQGDTYAVLKQEDIAQAKESYSAQFKGVLNLVPHPAQQFLNDTAPGDTLHYITPADAGSANHYQLLVRLVESHPELVFASLHTPVSATALYMLRVKDGVLMMEKRTRSQSTKALPSVGGEVNDALFAQLDGMLPMFVTDYDAAAYEDRYVSALAEMIATAEQVAGTRPAGTPGAPVIKVNDDELLAKLQALQGGAAKKPAKKTGKGQQKKASKVETAA